ncbi:hypothetical protein CYMTET_53001 [Cymbomonas tetramitiformis]|uniref:Uncharacterized protein n=1 Tax=Cymbomonas tetramitiformis TaxID=36881 RepID=A0AAE0EQH4_9CHLO|nr:hypothetical protein CYMTET_53001 [Cymbomonas tetramitiformis]
MARALCQYDDEDEEMLSLAKETFRLLSGSLLLTESNADVVHVAKPDINISDLTEVKISMQAKDFSAINHGPNMEHFVHFCASDKLTWLPTESSLKWLSA